MAVATINAINVPASSVNPPAGVEVTFTASNQTGGGNRFRSTGREVVLARNVGASTRTITVTSQTDPYGRTKDVNAVNIATNVYAVLPFFAITGWRDANGYITVTASHAEVELAVLHLPD